MKISAILNKFANQTAEDNEKLRYVVNLFNSNFPNRKANYSDKGIDIFNYIYTLPGHGWKEFLDSEIQFSKNYDDPITVEDEETDITPEPILQFFAYEHLPIELQAISINFYHLAHSVVQSLPRNPERSVALRKILEAKDAAVRAAIYK